jgi:hypothetical protein
VKKHHLLDDASYTWANANKPKLFALYEQRQLTDERALSLFPRVFQLVEKNAHLAAPQEFDNFADGNPVCADQLRDLTLGMIIA